MTRPRVENFFDPHQPRDAAGRWTESKAVAKSREATERTAKLAGHDDDVAGHREAHKAHDAAASGHAEMARKHGQLGNRRAAARFRSQSEHHRELANHHATKGAPLAPGPARARQRSGARSVAAFKGHERRGEREEAARVNIRPDYLPLWERRKGEFKGTPHQRYEAFEEYADAHPDEVSEALQEDSDRQLADLMREYQQEGEAMANPRRKRKQNEEEKRFPLTLGAWIAAAGIPPEQAYGNAGQRYVDAWRAGESPDAYRVASSPGVVRYEAEQVTVVEAEAPAPTTNPGEAPSYKAAHWGIKPRSKRGTTMDVPDPRVNVRAARRSGPKAPFVELGFLVSVVYCTSKGGDPDLTEYEHAFEDEHPILVYGRTDGKLYIAGGTYRVETRGIVG